MSEGEGYISQSIRSGVTDQALSKNKQFPPQVKCTFYTNHDVRVYHKYVSNTAWDIAILNSYLLLELSSLGCPARSGVQVSEVGSRSEPVPERVVPLSQRSVF